MQYNSSNMRARAPPILGWSRLVVRWVQIGLRPGWRQPTDPVCRNSAVNDYLAAWRIGEGGPWGNVSLGRMFWRGLIRKSITQ